MTNPRRKNLARFAWKRHFSGWLQLSAALLVGLTGCSGRLPSSYYRVTAHLMHGDEPVIIDWVVECRYYARSGEMRGYVRGTVVPYVFGVETRDHGMALMVAPAYCGQKGKRTDYLPFLMWGDKAGDFSFFEAYVSPKAFDNPGSQLKIVGVELRPSDQAEYDAWKKTARKNVVPAKPNPFLEDVRGASATCIGFARMLIPRSLQAAVDQSRPAEQPLYWIANRQLNGSVAGAVGGWESDPFSTPLSEGYGLQLADENFHFDVFPEGDRGYFQRHFNGADRKLTSGTDLVALDPARLGMMSCGALPFDANRHGWTAFEFPDGTAPPVHLTAIDFLAIIRGTETLFHRRQVEFDIERGDEGDE